jgi:hypothetical protein
MSIREELASETLEELIEVFNKFSLNNQEIIIVLSNLGYTLGASMCGYEGKGPSPIQVQQMYMEHPQHPGIALMMQSILMNHTWNETIEQAKDELENNRSKNGTANS